MLEPMFGDYRVKVLIVPHVYQDKETGLYHPQVIQTRNGEVSISRLAEGFSSYSEAYDFAHKWADALRADTKDYMDKMLDKLREMLEKRAGQS